MSEPHVAAPTARDIEILPAIMALTWRYSYAVDSRNVDLMASLFTRTARFGRDYGTGPEGAAAFYRTIWRNFRRSVHRVTNQLVTRTGDETATGIIYCTAEQERAENEWHRLQFAYFDDYVVEDGCWRFERRRLRFWFTDLPHERVYGSRTAGSAADGDALPEAWSSWRQYWSTS